MPAKVRPSWVILDGRAWLCLRCGTESSLASAGTFLTLPEVVRSGERFAKGHVGCGEPDAASRPGRTHAARQRVPGQGGRVKGGEGEVECA